MPQSVRPPCVIPVGSRARALRRERSTRGAPFGMRPAVPLLLSDAPTVRPSCSPWIPPSPSPRGVEFRFQFRIAGGRPTPGASLPAAPYSSARLVPDTVEDEMKRGIRWSGPRFLGTPDWGRRAPKEAFLKKRKTERGRFPSRRKAEAVLWLLRGEDLDLLSREPKVTPSTLSGWRTTFLSAGPVLRRARRV